MNSITNFLEQHLFTCSIKSMFGIDCPGCGLQRAFIALLKGNFIESLQLNASLIPLLITIIYVFGHLLFSFKNGARHIVVLVLVTTSTAMVNFVIKLILHS